MLTGCSILRHREKALARTLRLFSDTRKSISQVSMFFLLILTIFSNGCLSFRAAQRLSKSGVILTKNLAHEMEYIQNQLNDYDELKVFAQGLQEQQPGKPERTKLYKLAGEAATLLNALALIYEEMKELVVTEKGDTSVKGEDLGDANETLVRRVGEYACLLGKFQKGKSISVQTGITQNQMLGACLHWYFKDQIIDRRDTKTASKKIAAASEYLRTLLHETHEYIEEALKADERANIGRVDNREDYVDIVIGKFGLPSLENIINHQFDSIGIKWRDIDKILETSENRNNQNLHAALRIVTSMRIHQIEETRTKRLNNLRSALRELRLQHFQLERGQPINDELILSYLPMLYPYAPQAASKLFGF